MKLSASIMAHPDRVDLVRELETALDRPVPIAWDDEGKPSGNSDRVWRTARRGWNLADPEADFHLLLQDDAIVSADLLAGLERALKHVPADAVLSPYLGRGGAASTRWLRLGLDAEQRGASFVVSAKVMWGVALLLPTRAIPDMIEAADRMTGVPDDMRVAGWVRRRHLDVWYPWPSLVDHRLVPSITKHHARDRVAVQHHTGSALELSWDGPVVYDPMLVRERGPRSGPSQRRRVMSPTVTGTGKAGNGA